MALDASRVRVALTGHIFFRPKGVDGAEPTSPTQVPEGARELGFTSDDGVTISRETSTEDIYAWQTTSPVRRIVTETPTTASFTLMQSEANVLTAALGGTVKPAGDGFIWEPKDGDLVEGALYITFKDGDYNYLYGFRRAQQSGAVEMTLTRSGALTFPTEWTALATDDGTPSMFVLTDDPAFGTTPTPTPTTATTATAGTPGTLNGTAPANLDAMSTVTASPTTAWTTGQYVVLGDGSHAYWTGTAWAAGEAA